MVLLGLAVALSAYVFYPITKNYFFGDDFFNLYRIVNEGFVAFVQRPHGGHILATRNTLFYLFHALFGTNAEAYFWVVLATHLINVALLFSVIRLLTDSPRVACLGAILWGVTPCSRGALGWYSVYGHVVVATFVLCVLYGLGRLAAGRQPRRLAPLAWALLLLAAATSFGVGIGSALVMPFVAFLILPPSPRRVRIVGSLLLVALIVPPLYFSLQWIHVHWFNGNEVALPFLLSGLTYKSQILGLALHLTGYGITALVSGPLHDPTHYPGFVGYGTVLGFVAVVAAGFVRGPTLVRRQVLAFLLLTAGCYGMIALGRGVFFASEARLGLIRSERFQYMGQLALTVTFCTALAGLGSWRVLSERIKTISLLVWLVAVVLLELRIGTPIDHYAAARRETNLAVWTLRSAIESAPVNDLYFENRPFRGVGHLLASPTLFPGWAGIFTIFFPSNRVDGKQIHFIVDNDEAVSIARRGRRTADLIVSPDEARQRDARPIELQWPVKKNSGCQGQKQDGSQ
jgi:hypothetical protein